MSLTEIVNCAPWRLPSPRPLTAFEWAVVGTAVAETLDRVQFGFGRSAEAAALVGAIAAQRACPAWTTSMFGPAPAVATYQYRCLAFWFGTNPPPSRAAILRDIGTGLLCTSSPPWGACPPQALGPRVGPTTYWEGGQQVAAIPFIPSGTEPCAFHRDRIVYLPMTGAELVKMLQFLGPQVPADLLTLAKAAPSLFMNRSFLIGVQAKKGVTGTDISMSGGDITRLAQITLEDAAIIWAPGQGTSVMPYLSGPIDPAKLIALLNQMSPTFAADVLSNLPGLLGSLPAIQNLPALADQFAPQIQAILTSAGQMLPAILGGGGGMHGFGAVTAGKGQPGTPATTGVTVVDKTGSSVLATFKATGKPTLKGQSVSLAPDAGVAGSDLLYWVAGVAALVGIIALLRST